MNIVFHTEPLVLNASATVKPVARIFRHLLFPDGSQDFALTQRFEGAHTCFTRDLFWSDPADRAVLRAEAEILDISVSRSRELRRLAARFTKPLAMIHVTDARGRSAMVMKHVEVNGRSRLAHPPKVEPLPSDPAAKFVMVGDLLPPGAVRKLRLVVSSLNFEIHGRYCWSLVFEQRFGGAHRSLTRRCDLSDPKDQRMLRAEIGRAGINYLLGGIGMMKLARSCGRACHVLHAVNTKGESFATVVHPRDVGAFGLRPEPAPATYRCHEDLERERLVYVGPLLHGQKLKLHLVAHDRGAFTGAGSIPSTYWKDTTLEA
jgi:hypothetical protein